MSSGPLVDLDSNSPTCGFLSLQLWLPVAQISFFVTAQSRCSLESNEFDQLFVIVLHVCVFVLNMHTLNDACPVSDFRGNFLQG